MAPELQISDSDIDRVAEQTEGFSYAYLKELWLSSIMAWINGERVAGSMTDVMLSQIEFLREQMTKVHEVQAPPAHAADAAFQAMMGGFPFSTQFRLNGPSFDFDPDDEP